MKYPTLTIVFGTRDRPMDVRRLLDSIDFTVPPKLNYEIVIADASQISIDEQAITTKEMWDRIRILPDHPPLGCTKAYNAAFRAAQGRFCLWVNDDCEFESGCIVNAIEFMKANPKVGIGAIAYAELSEAGKRATYRINSYFEMAYANFGIISRTFGDEIGWFDEEFPMYGNDNSLTFRCLLAGRGIAPIPGSRIVHHATVDYHRILNNDPKRRISDGERLIAKYQPYVKKMRAVYKDCASQFENLIDQTPTLNPA